MHNTVFLLDYAPKTWGTREDYFAALCSCIRRRGAVAVLTCSEHLSAAIHQRFVEHGAEVVVLPFQHGASSYFRGLGRLIRKYSISLAQIRYFDYFSPVAWFARLHGVRRIVYTEANSGEWNNRVAWKRALVRGRARAACHPLTRMIAVSGFIRERLIALGLDPGRIDVVYNGVDTTRFSPDPAARAHLAADFGFAAGDLVVSSASVLLGWKCPDVVVRACALLAARGVSVRLFVAGDGPLRGSLEDLARSLGLAGRVHWLGHCADPERVLRASDVFVLASVGEAFGNVLAEAMACGVPVVGARSGAIPEVVEDGRTGLLADPHDPASFADAIKRLAADAALRRCMGEEGRRRACSLFSLDAWVRNTLHVYDAIH